MSVPEFLVARGGPVRKELDRGEPLKQMACAADLWFLIIGPRKSNSQIIFSLIPSHLFFLAFSFSFFTFRVFISLCFKFYFKVQVIFTHSLKSQIVLEGFLHTQTSPSWTSPALCIFYFPEATTFCNSSDSSVIYFCIINNVFISMLLEFFIFDFVDFLLWNMRI